MKNGAAFWARTEVPVPYPQSQRRSTLTAWAIEGRAAALDDPLDGSAASAGPALPVVDLEGLGKIAQRPVGRSKIAQGRAAPRAPGGRENPPEGGPAGRDPSVRARPDGGHEPPQALERDRPAGAARIDA